MTIISLNNPKESQVFHFLEADMEAARVDQVFQEGSVTRQSVDNSIIELSAVLKKIEAMNRVNELPLEARRLLFEIQGGVYRAFSEARDAQVILKFGKREK